MKHTRAFYGPYHYWIESEADIAKSTGPRMIWETATEHCDCWFVDNESFDYWLDYMLINEPDPIESYIHKIIVWNAVNTVSTAVDFFSWYKLCHEVRDSRCFDDAPGLRRRFLQLAKEEILLQLGIS